MRDKFMPDKKISNSLCASQIKLPYFATQRTPFSVSIPAGKISFLLGPNGSGKSTLLKILLGVLRPQVGTSCTTGMSAAHRMAKVAWVDQNYPSDIALGVKQVIALSGASEEQIRQVLKDLELLAMSDRPYQNLSGGEQKRVQLARAVAQNAQWLLLDEPFANLDLHHVLALQKTLVNLTQNGTSVLLSTHEPNHLLQVPLALQGDAIILAAGELVHNGPIANQDSWVKAIEKTFALKCVAEQSQTTSLISFVSGPENELN